MSDVAITALQKRVEELTAQVTTLNAEAKTRRLANKKLTAELETTKGQVTSLTTDRDEWKTKATAAPSDLQAKLDAAHGKLAQRDHSDVFTTSLASYKVKGEDGKETEYTLNQGAKLDDVWQALGYKPEGQAPDGPAATKLIGDAMKAKPSLFAAKAAEGSESPDPARAGTTAVTTRATQPGPGASRSVTDPASTTPQSARARIDSDYAKTGKDRVGRIA